MNANTPFLPMAPTLVLELNELCPPILDEMMAKGELPNFKKLYAQSDVYVTHTDDADLEPWVQWVTFHTGKTQDVHGAKELDEGYRVRLPRIWDKLADKGVSSLVFGSMNSAKLENNVALLPDPWSVRVRPSMPDYEAFHKFIQFHVTEHTSKVAKPSRKLTMDFLRFVVANGLSLGTIMDAIKQVTSEKLSGKDFKWRRAMVLDLIMWDVFEASWKKQKPQFSTFFANSTAFLQHRYWRHMKPEQYRVKPSESEMDSYGDAVRASYRHMDQLVEKAQRLVGPKGRIVFVTALSQEANLRYEDIGGKFVYRPFTFQQLNAWIGGPAGATFEPVMTHQSWASFANGGDADKFLDALQSVTIAGETVLPGDNRQPVLEGWKDGERVFFYCSFISKVSPDTVIQNKAGDTILFSKLFDCMGQVNNSQHNRDGAFWVQRPDNSGKVHDGKLPLEKAHETLMALFA